MAFNQLKWQAGVALAVTATTMLLSSGTVYAVPPGPTFCSAESQLLPSAPEVGAIYAQAGAKCARSSDIETRIDATAFRDGQVVDSASGSCARGHFWNNQRCSIRTMGITNPSGQQDFKIVVKISFTVNKVESSRTTTSTSTGRY